MKKFLLAALAAIGLAGPAQATVYNVYTDADMDSINNLVSAGDRVIIHSNTYTVAPIPGTYGGGNNDNFRRQGSSSAQIIYQSLAGVADSVVVPDITPGASDWLRTKGFAYTSWKNITVDGSVTIEDRDGTTECVYDSLVGVKVAGSLYLLNTNYCVVSSCELGTDVGGDDSKYSGANVIQLSSLVDDYAKDGGHYNQFLSNTMYVRYDMSTGVTHGIFLYGRADARAGGPKPIHDNYFYNNKATVVAYQSTGSCLSTSAGGMLSIWGAYDNLFEDNKWTLVDSTTVLDNNCDPHAFYCRDESGPNTFSRDTIIIASGPGDAVFDSPYFSASGTSGTDIVGNERYDCVYMDLRTAGQSLSWQFGFAGDINVRCQFINVAGHASPPYTNHAVNPTVYTSPDTAITLQLAGLFDGCLFAADSYEDGAFFFKPALWSNNVQVKNSIFYTGGSTTTTDVALTISPGNGSIASQWWGDYNCFYHKGSGSSAQPQIRVGTATSGTDYTLAQWQQQFGKDANSFWGPPGFTDSTMTEAAWDPTPATGSLLLGAGEYGADIGPIQSTSDGTRPAAVTTLIRLYEGEKSATFRFKSTGDDSLTGNPLQYVICYAPAADTVLTDGTFFDAGSKRTYVYGSAADLNAYNVVNVSNVLTPNTSYYVAVKIRDEVVGQWSAISNIVFFTTRPSTGGGGQQVIDPGEGLP